MTEKDFRKRLDKIRGGVRIITDELNLLYNDFADFEKKTRATGAELPRSAIELLKEGNARHNDPDEPDMTDWFERVEEFVQRADSNPLD